MTLKSQHISVAINRPAAEVYEFASNYENLPKWATGLEDFKGKIKFAEKNKFGVLDHDVTLPSGEVFYNPMRVFPNGDGSEVVFTLFRQPGMSDEAVAKDAGTIRKDLEKLKALLENRD